MGKLIGFAGCKSTTGECIEQLVADGYEIAHLITLTPKQAEKYHVSGYADLRPLAARHGVDVHHPVTYKLTAERDREEIGALGLDALIVVGWQRLVPPWLLDSLSVGAFGSHGSALPLPKGRGRSPINWSILQGETNFISHLIRYDEGVDSGAIVGTLEFDISPFDNCETIHFKSRIAMNRLLRDNLPGLLDGTAQLTQQEKEGATYFPKRGPEDGIIDWTAETSTICDLVRAVTHPFPGAFTYLEGEQLFVWRAQPFDNRITYPDAEPGQVVETFHNGQFLTRAGDSTVLVTEYSGVQPERIRSGTVFSNA